MNTFRLPLLFLATFALALVCACTPLRASAQYNLPGAENAIIIDTSALHPAPGEAVHLTAKSSLVDLSVSTLSWRSGGKVIAQGVGVVSADIVVGALGVPTTVTVSVSATRLEASAEATIIPTELDLLVDSDSYVPPLYRGRALPSAGTGALFQAIPRFKRPGGAFVPASDLIYTWRKNGEVESEISGRGRSSVRIPLMHLFGTDTISVEAKSADGTLSGEATTRLSAQEPRLVLYEDHPLFGTLFNNALGASTFVPESEMTFSAIPYFAQATALADPSLIYEWRVSGLSVPAEKETPNEITINASNSTGIALVELAVSHATNFYMDLKNSWNITFSSEGGALDQFHTPTQ